MVLDGWTKWWFMNVTDAPLKLTLIVIEVWTA